MIRKVFNRLGVLGSVAAGLLLLGGIAAAVILLTTNITGTATVNEVETSNSVVIDATTVNGSRLDCSGITTNADSTQLSFNPVLTKPVGPGANASNSEPVPGGTCTINIAVTNTGDTPITMSGSSEITPPTGWTVTDLNGSAFGTIVPDATGTATAKLTATQAAVTGPVTGKLVYTDTP